jgi:hypothetical protein
METKNLDIYGSEPIPWTRAREALAGSRDIHRVCNQAPTTAISLHTYGTDVSRAGSSVRRYYD